MSLELRGWVRRELRGSRRHNSAVGSWKCRYAVLKIAPVLSVRLAETVTWEWRFEAKTIAGADGWDGVVKLVRLSQFVPDSPEGYQVGPAYAVTALDFPLGWGLIELHGAPAVSEQEEESLARSYVLFSAKNRLFEKEVVYCRVGVPTEDTRGHFVLRLCR
jgi:hypothetical protein